MDVVGDMALVLSKYIKKFALRI